MVAGRRPFPHTSMGRIIQAMKGQKVMSQAEITEYRICHIRAGSLPAAGIKTLQPHPGSVVQMAMDAETLLLIILETSLG